MHWFISGFWWNACLGIGIFIYAVGVVIEMFDYALDPHPWYKVMPVSMRQWVLAIFMLPFIPFFMPGGLHAYGDAVLVAI